MIVLDDIMAILLWDEWIIRLAGWSYRGADWQEESPTLGPRQQA